LKGIFINMEYVGSNLRFALSSRSSWLTYKAVFHKIIYRIAHNLFWYKILYLWPLLSIITAIIMGCENQQN
jgi:hypothetical protein